MKTKILLLWSVAVAAILFVLSATFAIGLWMKGYLAENFGQGVQWNPDYVSLGIWFITYAIVAIAAILIYFAPTFIAAYRKLGDVWAILVINLFLGWTIVGWVVALAWAVAARRDR